MSDRMRVGFVGAGLMGHGMAKNIVEGGFPLTVLPHRNREPVKDLKGRGATEAASVEEVAAASDVIFLCLPGSPEVEAVAARLLAAGMEGKTVVDTSTANPVSTRALAARIAEAGGVLLDAPLSRTPKEAWEGKLDVMVGGAEADVERVRPLLDCIAGRIVHVGPTGAGHTMKLLNNLLSLGYATIYAEALAIGAKNGVTPEVFHSVISGGRMDCGFYQTFMQYVVGHDPNAHRFALRNAHKDVRYVTALGNESGIATHVTSAIKNVYATAEATGHGDDYLPTIADVVRRLNGID